eukprot:569730-Rhodomonas_salina.1
MPRTRPRISPTRSARTAHGTAPKVKLRASGLEGTSRRPSLAAETSRSMRPGVGSSARRAPNTSPATHFVRIACSSAANHTLGRLRLRLHARHAAANAARSAEQPPDAT